MRYSAIIAGVGLGVLLGMLLEWCWKRRRRSVIRGRREKSVCAVPQSMPATSVVVGVAVVEELVEVEVEVVEELVEVDVEVEQPSRVNIRMISSGRERSRPSPPVEAPETRAR